MEIVFSKAVWIRNEEKKLCFFAFLQRSLLKNALLTLPRINFLDFTRYYDMKAYIKTHTKNRRGRIIQTIRKHAKKLTSPHICMPITHNSTASVWFHSFYRVQWIDTKVQCQQCTYIASINRKGCNLAILVVKSHILGHGKIQKLSYLGGREDPRAWPMF